jgi:pyruvate dehydrogenase E2 component (dihydrolipoamide acetyltransferase)
LATNVPIATEVMTADVDPTLKLIAGLREKGVKVTFTALVLAAVSHGLERHPELAAVVDYEGWTIDLPEQVNVGVAVASDRGLIVPVVPNVIGCTLEELLDRFDQVVGEARSGSKRRELYAAGHFTITNIGIEGVEGGFPILQVPQIAILGVGAIRRLPVVVNEEIRVGSRSELTLAIDHRILDGVSAARFLKSVAKWLGNPDLSAHGA